MSNQLGTIAILGSGETSPNLVAVHRKLLQEIPKPAKAYMLDSPFGFQENAEQLVEKIQDFYDLSLNIKIKLASYRNKEELNTKSFFKTISLLEKADFIFAGPGSPSYASKLWVNNEIEETLFNHIKKGANALFASAAATTLGENTLPVYEIYKVGIDPYWEEGLDLLGLYGLSCTVVPHFNNREGGNHDTSFSYVGKNRMSKLMEINYSNLLGIDEHTALIISGKENTFEVYGLGQVTVINEDKILEFKSGETYDLTTLQNHLSKSHKDKSSEINQEAKQNKSDETLRKIANLEIQIEENESNSKIFKKLVTQLIDLRLKLRSEKNYEMSDIIRDILESSNIQIEEFEGKIDSSYVRWVNDCEMILSPIKPKKMSEKKNIFIKILTTNDSSYTYEYSYLGESNKLKANAIRIR